jgi:hypothetical protein
VGLQVGVRMQHIGDVTRGGGIDERWGHGSLLLGDAAA